MEKLDNNPLLNTNLYVFLYIYSICLLFLVFWYSFSFTKLIFLRYYHFISITRICSIGTNYMFIFIQFFQIILFLLFFNFLFHNNISNFDISSNRSLILVFEIYDLLLSKIILSIIQSFSCSFLLLNFLDVFGRIIFPLVPLVLVLVARVYFSVLKCIKQLIFYIRCFYSFFLYFLLLYKIC